MKRRVMFTSCAVVTLLASVLFWPDPGGPDSRAPVPLPELIRIAAGPQDYRPAGEFRQGTRVVDAPRYRFDAGELQIMKNHVSEADYARCVAENACSAAPTAARPDYPQTNLNHGDATAYAAWLSARTDQLWRLPTDAEWLRAAAERGNDDGFSKDANGSDPSRRWIASYLREVELRGESDLLAHPVGHFGENTLGVADIAGNVWEWTDTCFQNGTLTPDGTSIRTQSDYCGVRAVQGKHRAFVIDFIRDARSGGCGGGVPPDYLGFRLVRETAD